MSLLPFVLLALSGCGKSAPAAATSEAKASPSTFHANGDAFDGRGTSYVARLRADGSLQISAGHGESLRLTTREAGATSAAIRQSDGSVVTARGAYRERWETKEAGIEQSFLFAARPASPEVDLHIGASGLSYIGRDRRGLLFGGAKTKLRYGTASWVDANGASTRLSPTWDPKTEEIALHVPAAVLDTTAYPAVLDPLIGPENGVDAPLATGVVLPQYDVQLGGSDGKMYAVWYDQRRELSGLIPDSYDLFGARIDLTTGSALASDASGVPLVRNIIRGQIDPIVASVDGSFCVFVTDQGLLERQRIDGSTGAPTTEDPAPVPIAELAATTTVAAAAGAHNYVVAWAAGAAVYVQRIPLTGAALDPSPVAIATGQGATNAKIACTDDVCVLAWTNATSGDSRFVRYHPADGTLDPHDTPTAPTLAPVQAGELLEGVTYGNGTFLVTWGANPASPPGPFYGARVDPATGTIVQSDTMGVTMMATTPETGSTVASNPLTPVFLAYDGARYVASWNSSGIVFAETFDGTTLLPETNASGTGAKVFPSFGLRASQSTLAVVGGATYIGATFVSGTEQTVAGALFDDATRTAAASTPIPITTLANAEITPAIAATDAGALVTWTDDRAPTAAAPFSIFGAPLDRQGVALVDGGAAMARSATQLAQYPALVAFGADYVLAWISTTASGSSAQLNVVEVDGTSGQMTGPIDVVPGVPNPPSLATDGTHVAVAYTFGSNVGAHIYTGTDVSSFQSLTIESSLLLSGAAFEDPSVAAAGGNFLVVWTAVPLSGDVSFELDAARFTADGKLYGSDTGAVFSSVPASQLGAHVASGGGKYLVAWSDNRQDPSLLSIYARVVDPAGGLQDHADILVADRLAEFFPGGADEPGPAVVDAADGESFQLVWTHESQLYGALVGHDGVTRDKTPTLLASASGGAEFDHPALAALPASPGAMLLAYSREDLSPGVGGFRVDTRTLTTGPLAGTCTAATDCATRNCVDGVCCDTACDGVCQSCALAGSIGVCTNVTDGQDPGTCAGTSTCIASSAGSECVATLGVACAAKADCASGNCVDGVCCESACAGGCDVCNATPGKCTVVAAGSTGASPACLPYICDGASHICPSVCAADTDCVRPYVCGPGGTCELASSGFCVDGATLKTPDGTLTSCAPFVCAANACVTRCASIKDCSGGALCDANGECVAASPNDASSGGCTVGAGETGVRGRDLAGVGMFICAFGLSRRKRRRR